MHQTVFCLQFDSQPWTLIRAYANYVIHLIGNLKRLIYKIFQILLQYIKDVQSVARTAYCIPVYAFSRWPCGRFLISFFAKCWYQQISHFVFSATSSIELNFLGLCWNHNPYNLVHTLCIRKKRQESRWSRCKHVWNYCNL